MADEKLNVLANKSVSALQDFLSPAEIKDDDCAEAYKSFITEVHNADTAEMWFLLREALKSDERRSNVIEDIIDLINRDMVKGLDAEVQKTLKDKNISPALVEDAYKHLNTSFDGDATRAEFDKKIQAIVDQKAAATSKGQTLKERSQRKCCLM